MLFNLFRKKCDCAELADFTQKGTLYICNNCGRRYVSPEYHWGTVRVNPTIQKYIMKRTLKLMSIVEDNSK